MRQYLIIACLLACIGAQIVFYHILNTPRWGTYLSASRGDGEAVQVEINDYYAETADGIQKYFVAAYLQINYEYLDCLDPQIKKSVNNLRKTLIDKAIENGWKHYDWYIYEAPSDAGYDEFRDFFKEVDRRTDGDDKLILIIVGHGEEGDNGYYRYVLGDGTKVCHDALVGLMNTLGPPLDFVLLGTCHGYSLWEGDGGTMLSTLKSAARTYEIWMWSGELHDSFLVKTLSIMADLISQGKTSTGEVFSKVQRTYGSWHRSWYKCDGVTILDFVESYGVYSSETPLDGTTGTIIMPPSGIVITPY